MVLIYDFAAQFDETKELATVIASMDVEHVAPRPVQPMEPARLGIEGDDTTTDESPTLPLPPSPLPRPTSSLKITSLGLECTSTAFIHRV